MKKYLFSILTLLLCFPVMVSAANEAKIGETEYATIEEAITAATDGQQLLYLVILMILQLQKVKK